MLTVVPQRLLITAVVAAGLTVSAGARADDRCYMIVFAAQVEPSQPRYSHTFATFVRVPDQGELETRTISWMPRSLTIEPFRMSTVPGINLDLPDTLKWTKSVNARVTMWGPFAIRQTFYERAAKYAEWLNTSPIQYVMADRKFRGKGGVNCIHALTDMDTTQPQLDSGAASGEEASLMAVKHFRPYIVSTDQPADWLVQKLGLKSAGVRAGRSDDVLPGATP
jgi:hypothetical protein